MTAELRAILARDGVLGLVQWADREQRLASKRAGCQHARYLQACQEERTRKAEQALNAASYQRVRAEVLGDLLEQLILGQIKP